MKYDHLLNEVEQFVRSYTADHDNPGLTYHNLNHTKKVVEAAEEIAGSFDLSKKDFCVVMTAAWFHDLGHYINSYDHESHSVTIATEFLKTKSVDEDVINAIASCILATRMPQNPKNELERIICDADLYNLGTDSFKEINKQLRQEAKNIKGLEISKEDWNRGTIALLEYHHYFTDYCKKLLNEKKQLNLLSVKKKIAAEPEIAKKEKESVSLEEVKDKKESKSPDKAVDNMFRITSGNNQRLSDMADKKADILITVNSIILSAILSLLVRKLDGSEHLILPTVLILAVSVTTMIFAILATRPSIPDGTFTQKDLDERKVNLIFFGNFYKMSLDQYHAGMKELVTDRAYLYDTLVKDVYFQGVVLGRKYRLLRVAYNVFMFGLIISVLAFIISFTHYFSVI